MKSVTYRPRLDRGLLAVAAGLLFAGVGWGGLRGTGGDLFFLPFLLLGTLALLAGVAALSTRVVVDSDGMRKSPRWPGGFRVAWAEVESWSAEELPRTDVDESDSFTFRAVRLRLRGRRVTVTDSEAYRPAFDTLVDRLRGRLPEREVGLPPKGTD